MLEVMASYWKELGQSSEDDVVIEPEVGGCELGM